MIGRIKELDSEIPIWFIYGSKSWIDKEAGHEVMKIREQIGNVNVKVDLFFKYKKCIFNIFCLI